MGRWGDGWNMTLEEFSKSKGYADLARLPEDERIDLIGRYVIETKQTVGVLTDSGRGDEGKPARYIDKFKKRFPSIQIIGKENGPIKNTVCIRIGPPVN